jgi:hypothetical protein
MTTSPSEVRASQPTLISSPSLTTSSCWSGGGPASVRYPSAWSAAVAPQPHLHTEPPGHGHDVGDHRELALRAFGIHGPLKPATLATTRLTEHWAHALDITGPLGIELPDTGRLRHVA